jgi:hypothetical protein
VDNRERNNRFSEEEHMKKKLLGLLIFLCLAAALCVTAMAAENVEVTLDFTTKTANDSGTGNSGTWSWDQSTKTLKMTNLVLVGTDYQKKDNNDSGGCCGILLPDGSTVVVSGQCSVTSGKPVGYSASANGIVCYGLLTIVGQTNSNTDSLSVTASAGSPHSNGICATSLTVENVTLTAESGAAGTSAGIDIENIENISTPGTYYTNRNSALIIKDHSVVTAKSIDPKNYNDFGIYILTCMDVKVLLESGSSLDVSSSITGSDISYGFKVVHNYDNKTYLSGNVSLQIHGTFKAVSNNANYESCALKVSSDDLRSSSYGNIIVDFTGADLILQCGTAGKVSCPYFIGHTADYKIYNLQSPTVANNNLGYAIRTSSNGTYQSYTAQKLSLPSSPAGTYFEMHVAPPAPTGLTAAPGVNQAVLSWTAPEGVSSPGYVLQYSASADFSNPVTVSPAPTGTTATVTGLTNGTTYHFRLWSVVNQMQSASCAEASAMPASSDAALSALTTSAGELTPAFDSGTFLYAVTLPSAADSITLTPTVRESHAAVTVNGAAAASGKASAALSLNVGDNAETVAVTAQDGTTKKTYTVAVHRQSGDVTLKSLALVTGSVSKDLDLSGKTIAVTVPFYQETAALAPVTNDARASAAVNGKAVVSGRSEDTALHTGPNVFTVTVTAEDPGVTKTYTVTVTRGDPPAHYPVRLSFDKDGGSVTTAPETAMANELVRLQLAPKDGWRTGRLTVTDAAGNAVPVTKTAEGAYSFWQPRGGSVVTVSFVRLGVFADVDSTAWYADDVAYVNAHGLMDGTGPNRFSPQGTATRAMAVTILWRLAGSPAPESAAPFGDVPADAYYTQAAAWAAENRIAEGADGLFSPDAPVTRQELAALLYRYAGSKAVSAQPAFADTAKIAAWAKDAAAWTAAEGIVNGKPGNLFDPSDTATRAELAAMIHRFCTIA